MRLPLSRLFSRGPGGATAAMLLPMLMIVCVLVALLSLSGCALFESPNTAFVTGVDAGLNGSGLLDEYDKYIDADPNLKSDSKKIRHQTAAQLRKLIADAQGKKSAPAPTPPPPAPTPPPK